MNVKYVADDESTEPKFYHFASGSSVHLTSQPPLIVCTHPHSLGDGRLGTVTNICAQT